MKKLTFQKFDKDRSLNVIMKEEKLAEFIGIMLGDGSIGIYDTKAGNKIKKHRVVKVTLDSKNKQYIDYVFNLIKDVLKVEPRIHYKKKENAVDIRTFKINTFKYLTEDIGLKISPKWNKMEIPKKYMKEEFYSHVLKGLFDTDGSITIFNNNGIIYPRIEIKICPSPAQKQFIEIVSSLGFKYKIQNLDKGKIRIRISGVKELRKWFNLIGSSNELHIKKTKQFL